MEKWRQVLAKIWLGLVGATVLGLLWLSWPYTISAFYLDQGTRLIGGKDNQAAVRALEAALSSEPDNVLAYRQLAKAYFQIDEPDQALTVARQALALAPGNPVIQLELGDIYDRLGNAEQAIAHYEAGLVGDRRPQLTANYLQMADRLWASGDQTGAVTVWQDKVLGTGYGDLYANWRLTRYYKADAQRAEPYQNNVYYFSLESIVTPPDHRLNKYQAEAFAGAMTDGLWSREKLLAVLAYRVWQDQSGTAEDLLQSLVVENPTDADLHFYLGEVYYLQGNIEQAKATYQQTLTLDPQYIQAYLRLGMVAEGSCTSTTNCAGLVEAAGWYEQYHELAPDDLLGLKKLAEIHDALGSTDPEMKSKAASLWEKWKKQVAQQGPAVVENQTMADGWTFLGYGGEEARLVRGEPAPLWLYWQGPAGSTAGDEGKGWYSLGENQWVQVLEEAHNIILNGGFELGMERGWPSGFPRAIYASHPDFHTLSRGNRSGIHTTLALIKSYYWYDRVGLVSQYTPVEPDALYLQTGWMLSVEGSAFLGYRWAWDTPRKGSLFDYSVGGVTPDTWQPYAKLVQSLSSAEEVQIVFSNFDPTGQIGRTYFDNLMFIKVGRPGE